MELIVIWLAFAIITAIAASSRGRSFGGWLILGVLFGVFALVAVLVMGPVTPAQQQRASNASTTPAPTSTPTQPKPTAALEWFFLGDGSYSFDVAGEARRQSELEAIAGPRTKDGVDKTFTAVLEHDRFNTFDPNAMQVTIARKVVGFAPRDDAAEIMTMLRERNLSSTPIVANARITGGWQRNKDGVDDSGMFGVRLDISYPFQLETGSARRRRLSSESAA